MRRGPFNLHLQPRNNNQVEYISMPISHFPFPYVCMSMYFLVQERSRYFCLLQKFLGSAVTQSALTVPVVTGPAPLRLVEIAFFTIKNIHITCQFSQLHQINQNSPAVKATSDVPRYFHSLQHQQLERLFSRSSGSHARGCPRVSRCYHRGSN